MSGRQGRSLGGGFSEGGFWNPGKLVDFGDGIVLIGGLRGYGRL